MPNATNVYPCRSVASCPFPLSPSRTSLPTKIITFLIEAAPSAPASGTALQRLKKKTGTMPAAKYDLLFGTCNLPYKRLAIHQLPHALNTLRTTLQTSATCHSTSSAKVAAALSVDRPLPSKPATHRVPAGPCGSPRVPAGRCALPAWTPRPSNRCLQSRWPWPGGRWWCGRSGSHPPRAVTIVSCACSSVLRARNKKTN